MKGVILAGGLGTRLYPLTHVTNKHLLPIFDKPMIYYPIQTLVKAGITEVIIVVSGPHVGHFLGVLKNGKELGLKHLEYAYQEKPDGGIADALSLAENFADGEDVMVVLGDNTTDANIHEAVVNFEQGAHVFLKKVDDPTRFGIPVFDKDQKITRIDEKPQEPMSDLAVTGLYMYDASVFDKIKLIQPSLRGELEITDVNNKFIEEDRLTYSVIDGYWLDAGTFDTLLEAAKYWSEK